MRANASSKTLLKHFIELCSSNGKKYHVVVPWDEKNLDALKEYYSPLEISDLMDYYFVRYPNYNWTVKDFINKVQDMAGTLEADKLYIENTEKLMRETAARMREAGYDV